MARALPAPGVIVVVTPEQGTITVERPGRWFHPAEWVLPTGLALVVGLWGWSVARRIEQAQSVPWHLLPQIIPLMLLAWFAWALAYGTIARATSRMTFIVTSGFLEVTSSIAAPRR